MNNSQCPHLAASFLKRDSSARKLSAFNLLNRNSVFSIRTTRWKQSLQLMTSICLYEHAVNFRNTNPQHVWSMTRRWPCRSPSSTSRTTWGMKLRSTQRNTATGPQTPNHLPRNSAALFSRQYVLKRPTRCPAPRSALCVFPQRPLEKLAMGE